MMQTFKYTDNILFIAMKKIFRKQIEKSELKNAYEFYVQSKNGLAAWEASKRNGKWIVRALHYSWGEPILRFKNLQEMTNGINEFLSDGGTLKIMYKNT